MLGVITYVIVFILCSIIVVYHYKFKKIKEELNKLQQEMLLQNKKEKVISEKETELENQISDILSERKKLRLMADLDLLTRVYNKCTTSELIDNLLTEYPDMVHALVIIDLDNFKRVNDTLGHDAGDEVLVAVAKILRKCFRSTDIIGRIGGDEFVALVTDVGATMVAQERAENIRRAICSGAEPDIPEYVSASIGIAFGTGKVSFRELYRNADRALYEAKRAGKNQFKVYRE